MTAMDRFIFKIREVSYYMVIFMVSREAEVCFLLFAICQKYDALPLQFDAIENLNWYLRHLLLYGEVSDHAPAIFRVPPIDAPFH